MSSFDRGGSVRASGPVRPLPGPRISSRYAQTSVRCSPWSTPRHWCCIGSTILSSESARGGISPKTSREPNWSSCPAKTTFPFAGDTDTVLGEIEEFLTGTRGTPNTDRALGTILFTDISESTKRAADSGDRHWRELLDNHDRMAGRQVHRFGGRQVKTTGDGILATFDGPARAIQCGLAICDGAHQLGIEVRVGVHTGEVERRGDDIGGIGVHIAARVQAHAQPGEVWVSRTVTDLVTGSGITFHDRGEHPLKGVPEAWRLFSVEV